MVQARLSELVQRARQGAATELSKLRQCSLMFQIPSLITTCSVGCFDNIKGQSTESHFTEHSEPMIVEKRKETHQATMPSHIRDDIHSHLRHNPVAQDDLSNTLQPQVSVDTKRRWSRRHDGHERRLVGKTLPT